VLPASFRVALRSEPIYTPGALHPLVNFGFARQPFDVSDFDTGTVGLDLPVTLGNALWLKNDFDPGGFAHNAEYDPSRPGRKPYSGPCLDSFKPAWTERLHLPDRPPQNETLLYDRSVRVV
jgi:hypothetical protein